MSDNKILSKSSVKQNYESKVQIDKVKCKLGFHKARVGRYSEKSIPSDCWCLRCGKLLYFTLFRNGIEIKNKRDWEVSSHKDDTGSSIHGSTSRFDL